MFHKARKRNRSRIENYIEIYLKTELRQIINRGKKKIYKRKINNIVGKDIKAELPTSPDIKIENNFEKNIKQLSKEIIKDIKRIINGKN